MEHTSHAKVSIVMAVYNVEKYLANCLDTVLGQTFSDIEVIAVDDGSSDNSFQILKQYQQKDKRLRIIKQKNSGPSAARNRGLDETNGTYVLFVDSDDYIHKKMVEILVNEAESGNFDMVCCNIVLKDEAGKTIDKFKVRKTGNQNGGLEALKLFLSGQLYRPALYNKLIRREVLVKNKLHFHPGIYFEDTLLSTETLFAAKRIKTISEDLYFYVRHTGSITRSLKPKHFNDMAEMLNITERFLLKHKVMNDVKMYWPGYCGGKWGYLLKMVIKVNPNKENYIAFRKAIPEAFWKNISGKYRMFWKIGCRFPKLPGLVVKQP